MLTNWPFELKYINVHVVFVSMFKIGKKERILTIIWSGSFHSNTYSLSILLTLKTKCENSRCLQDKKKH